MTARAAGVSVVRLEVRSDRGAILVHVAASILGLLAVTMFVVDYGVFWLGRNQAQNAADAGALAGAVAMAYDDNEPYDLSDSGVIKQSALTVAQKNGVFGVAAGVNVTTDVTFPACPDGAATCVRVDVHHTAARGNALPMFFGGFVGRTTQDVRATATAQVKAANASMCLKPWGLPDRWIENHPAALPWTKGQVFDDLNGDVYVAPSPPDPGSGMTLEDFSGTQVVLTMALGGAPVAHSFWPLEFDGACSTPACYQAQVSGCVGALLGVTDSFEGFAGGLAAETRQGVDDLINLDPGASWDAGQGTVTGSCVAAGTCPAYQFSPRVVAVPLVRPDVGTTLNYTIVNIVGLFIDQRIGDDIVAYVVPMNGVVSTDHGPVAPPAAFLRNLVLVR